MGKEEKEAASIINRSLTLNTTIVLLKRKREREKQWWNDFRYDLMIMAMHQKQANFSGV